MSYEDSGAVSRWEQRRFAAKVLLSGFLLTCGLFVLGLVCGYRINFTPSEPVGVWRVRTIHHDVLPGDLVFICPPDIAIMKVGLDRGYLGSGPCPGGFAPLIKTVIAIEGQQFEVGASVVIDGRVVPGSAVLTGDARGRPLNTAKSSLVGPGEVVVFSSYRGSWDSRYFGPIPYSGILGLAEQILVIDLGHGDLPAGTGSR